MELAPQGITVNAILPGTILSDGLLKLGMDLGEATASIPLKRLGEPRDIGYAALFFASDQASYITGQTLVIDGGVTLIEKRRSGRRAVPTCASTAHPRRTHRAPPDRVSRSGPDESLGDARGTVSR